MHDIVDEIMRKRGLKNFVSHSDMRQPFEWPGVEQASEIMKGYLLSGKHIHVWGDYDADGVTATALVLSTLICLRLLNGFTYKISYHIPDRFSEGYGVNTKGIERAKSIGADLVLTVDCGISALDVARKARDLGIGFIVTDHHLPESELPEALAVCDPFLGSDASLEVAGVGQAFILMKAVCERLDLQGFSIPDMSGFLDLVALGSIADVTVMTGQNRVLCQLGLERMRKKPSPGIHALMQVSGLPDGEMPTSSDIGFGLGPRINAAGRLASAKKALNCLMSRDQQSAWNLARDLDHLNIRRKEMEKLMSSQAAMQAVDIINLNPGARGLVLHDPGWHAGILGITASRIAETFSMPVIIATGAGEVCKGSGRSWGDIDLHAILSECGDALLSFGGHRAAAGVSFKKSDLESLRMLFSGMCALRSPELQSAPQPRRLVSDRAQTSEFHDYPAARADANAIMELARLEPYGPGNPKPVFKSEPLVFRKIERMGKLVLLHFENLSTGEIVRVKKFRFDYDSPEKDIGKSVRIYYSLDRSYFRGRMDVNIDTLEIVAE